MPRKSDVPPPRPLRPLGPHDPLNALFDIRPRDATADQKLSLAVIHLNPDQPRRYFAPEKMQQLIASVGQHGILENLLVRPLPDQPGQYQLIAGERRYQAAQAVGLTQVPVKILNVTEQEALQIALVENLQRENLNPVEETEGILRLLAIQLGLSLEEAELCLYKMYNESIGNSNHNVVVKQKDTVEHVFLVLGSLTWQSFVKHRLPLLKLPRELLEALQQGKIEYTKAQAIAQVKDEVQRQELLEIAITEGLSIREIRDRIKKFAQNQKPTSRSAYYVKRFNSLGRKIKAMSAWDDEEKCDRLESLLKEIEALIQ